MGSTARFDGIMFKGKFTVGDEKHGKLEIETDENIGFMMIFYQNCKDRLAKSYQEKLSLKKDDDF